MSSNAATFGTAALVWADLRDLLDAGTGVAALSFTALQGNPEAFASAVAAARPLPGPTAVADRLRALTAGAGHPRGGRTRSGCAACRRWPARCTTPSPSLHDVLAVEINAAAENPLFAGGEALHNGSFHAAELRARTRQPAARAGPVRQPGGRPALAPDGARPHGPDAVPGRRRRQLGPDDRRVPGRRRARPPAHRRHAGRARLGVDLARARRARQLRLAVRRPRTSRRRPAAHRARPRVDRGGARAADARRPRRRACSARPRAGERLRRPARGPPARRGRARAPRRRCRPSPSWCESAA